MNPWKINNYDPSSKIWIYTISPKLSEIQEIEISKELEHFCKHWTAHNKELKAFYKIISNSILILGVDEHLNQASGCSIDKSVHFLEELENKHQLSFFDRLLFNVVNEQNIIETYNKKEFEKLIENNVIHSDSLVINTLSTNLAEWNENGVQAFSKSWMNTFFGINA